MIRVDFPRILQNVLVVVVRILATEATAPHPPPMMRLDELPPPESAPAKPDATLSLYKSDLDKVLRGGGSVPAGVMLSTDGKFHREHAEANRDVIASTSATVKRLRERLAEELYRMQMDLEDGAHIGGIPCDCLDGKHKLGLRATAKELLSMDSSQVPQKVLSWLTQHEAELNPRAIKQYGPDHYKALAGDMREFRKKLGE